MTRNAATIAKLRFHIDRIVNFLEPREFINCHMVAYLLDDLWRKFIPEGIRNEIKSNDDVDTAIEVFLNQASAKPELIRKHQNLFDHIAMTKNFYLENLDDKLFITTDELMKEFGRMEIPHSAGLNLSIREFMKEKKNHEVEIIAGIVAALSKARGRDHLIIDVGDGKGYLSSRLSLEFKLKVLGIDGNLQNTVVAEKRNKMLSKKWKALVTKEAKRSNNEDIEVEAVQSDLYKTTSKMIFSKTDLKKLAQEAFQDDAIEDLCIVGLHTCGNLSPNSLKQFVENDDIKVVCNVGCCYHLIFEEFFNQEVRELDQQDDFGFPLSQHLRDQRYQLGRNARMLASQCYERVIHHKDMPDESLFFRALFEKLLREKWSPHDSKNVKLGRIKFKTFEEYLKKGCKKCGIEMDLSSDEIDQLLRDHETDRRLINLNYFLRLLTAKVIETLILCDRFLFLLENGADDVFLVKIFDPVVSPRNYALIAIKK